MQTDIAAEASHVRGEATRHSFDALYLSSHIFRLLCALPQQIAYPPDGQAMPGTCGAVNRHGDKLTGCLGFDCVALSGDQAHALKLQNHLMRAIIYIDIFGFDAQFRAFRNVVRI